MLKLARAQEWAYRVDLPGFNGPLDLLLHLVGQSKLDITAISLAAVADQYRAYLESLQQMNLEIESEYLVVFSQLLEIKSRVLLPPV
ncbi:MAG: segregation/condensation protein A, partial [Candidatus Eremiobacterota bacterium]